MLEPGINRARDDTGYFSANDGQMAGGWCNVMYSMCVYEQSIVGVGLVSPILYITLLSASQVCAENNTEG